MQLGKSARLFGLVFGIVFAVLLALMMLLASNAMTGDLPGYGILFFGAVGVVFYSFRLAAEHEIAAAGMQVSSFIAAVGIALDGKNRRDMGALMIFGIPVLAALVGSTLIKSRIAKSAGELA